MKNRQLKCLKWKKKQKKTHILLHLSYKKIKFLSWIKQIHNPFQVFFFRLFSFCQAVTWMNWKNKNTCGIWFLKPDHKLKQIQNKTREEKEQDCFFFFLIYSVKPLSQFCLSCVCDSFLGRLSLTNHFGYNVLFTWSQVACRYFFHSQTIRLLTAERAS